MSEVVVTSVGSQDQDTVVVFQNAKEDGDESVSLQVCLCSFLEEDVTLVEKNDCATLLA